MSEEANAIGEYESKVNNTRTWEHSSPMKLTYLTALTASSTSQIFESSSAFSPCSTGNSPSLVICRTLYSCLFPPRYFSLFPPFFPQPSLPLCLLSNLAAPVSLIPGVVRRVIMIEKIRPKNSSSGGGLQKYKKITDTLYTLYDIVLYLVWPTPVDKKAWRRIFYLLKTNSNN